MILKTISDICLFVLTMYMKMEEKRSNSKKKMLFKLQQL